MGKINWVSSEQKYEAIGYLATPGVIDVIEATVPADKVKKFKEEFRGRYTSEFPYVTKAGSKFGYQFRIYLSDTEDCPEFLETQLDDTYKNRINNTAFIRELVLEFGFTFTHQSQKTNQIEKLMAGHYQSGQSTRNEITAFNKGARVYQEFIFDLSRKIKEYSLPAPLMVLPEAKNHNKAIKSRENRDIRNVYLRQQLQYLGWIGEEYFYKNLISGNKEILRILNISGEYTVEWFNEGCVYLPIWEDKSVGKGCDMCISVGDKKLFIEVKSSKRNSPYFVMTSNEMQLMHKKNENYFIVKINYLEKLLINSNPEVMIFHKPYDLYFKPEKMKEATFVMGD